MATSTGDAKARVEVDLTKALNSLAAVLEGRHRSEAEISLLEAELARIEAKQAHIQAERASLLLELEASKGEASSLHARVEEDKEDMVKDYQGSLELIFAYDYGCCTFKTTSAGTGQRSWMACLTLQTNFLRNCFVNPRCPLAQAAIEAKDVEVDQGEAIEDSEGGCCNAPKIP